MSVVLPVSNGESHLFLTYLLAPMELNAHIWPENAFVCDYFLMWFSIDNFKFKNIFGSCKNEVVWVDPTNKPKSEDFRDKVVSKPCHRITRLCYYPSGSCIRITQPKQNDYMKFQAVGKVQIISCFRELGFGRLSWANVIFVGKS